MVPSIDRSVPICAGVPTKATSTVEGVLLHDITPLEMKVFDWFEDEGVDYTRTNVQVTLLCTARENIGQSNSGDEVANHNQEHSEQQIIETNAYIWAL